MGQGYDTHRLYSERFGFYKGTRLYLYNLSVQGHRRLSLRREIIENPKIKVVGGIKDEALKNKYTYYADQVYQMDQFVGDLVSALKKRGEDTVLVMYGDHLPSLEVDDKDSDLRE